MNENEEINKPLLKLVGLLTAVIMAGVGGSLGVGIISPSVVRPDPFTGLMGKELEERLNRKIDRIEERLRQHEKEAEVWKLKIQSNKDKVDYHFRKHP